VQQVTVQESHEFGVPAEQRYEVYDFRRPATLAREQSRVLESALESFARHWSSQFGAHIRVPCVTQLEELEVRSYDELMARLPVTSVIAVCTAAGSSTRPTISFPLEAALGWVSRLVGGKGEFRSAQRSLTEIERAIVKEMMVGVVRDLEYAMGEILRYPLSVDTLSYGAQLVQAAAPTDLMVVAEFSIQIGERAAPVTFALPLEVVRLDLNAPAAVPGAAPEELLRSQLGLVPVQLSLRLDDAAVDPQLVLSLREGDLIPLPHPEHRPLRLTVDGNTIATAAAGSSGSRLACVVVDTLEETA